MYRKYFKRPLDIVLSTMAILVFSPVIIITSLLLVVSNKGNIIFRQKRPGKNEKIFTIYKFKSMTDTKDVSGKLLPNEERITRFGKFIRKTSIDELPQLFNILLGDMSVVGPRPLKIDYLPLYSNEQKRRHLVRPGITGWAQINGRNMISHTKKFELDVWYVNNISFGVDCKVIYRTALKLINRQDVDESGVNPNIPFNGKN